MRLAVFACEIHTMAALANQQDPFTQYYGQLQHQGNMLQDHVRTGTYQRACLENPSDFRDKVVLDVGTGRFPTHSRIESIGER